MEKVPPVILLMGPTASGKTDFAVELVQKFPLEIVSVDSALIYRDMNIGTAKPSQEVLRKAPHHLIDILDPSESYSAAQFRADAQREITRILECGKIPLLVGGTMLYFRALERGLSDLPSAHPSTRKEIEEEAKEKGWQALHVELTHRDPVAAERIHPNDPQRILRALEVIRLTGQPLSSQQIPDASPLPYRWLRLGVFPEDRGQLHQRIALRFEKMLEKGLINEVMHLYQRGDLNSELPSMRAVGYRQVWRYLSGDWDRETMIEKAIVATRQLAKRQMTWLRGDQDLMLVNGEPSSLSKLYAWIGEFLKTSKGVD